MRILALYPFLPYPVVSGAAMRGCTVLDILTSAYEVTLVSFVGKDDSPAELPKWQAYSRLRREPILVSRQAHEELTPKGRELKKHGPNSRFRVPQGLKYFDSAAMWNRIAELDLNGFDAVHARFLTMTPYALAIKRLAPHVRIINDLDDNPTLLLYRKLRGTNEPRNLRVTAWYWKELARTFAYELFELRKFDSVWICSDVDLERMSRRLGRGRTAVIENVVDANKLGSLSRSATHPSVLMIADFNYSPNADGALFFLRGAWPRIRTAVPNAQLWLVGKNGRSDILSYDGKDGITVTGMVHDVKQYLAAATVSIAPLFVGTGTKLKILEALAAGLPVVTTRVGAEGIQASNGVNILFGETAGQFAEHCIALLQNPTLRERLSKAGRELVCEKYDIPIMNRAVLACYQDLGSVRDINP